MQILTKFANYCEGFCNVFLKGFYCETHIHSFSQFFAVFRNTYSQFFTVFRTLPQFSQPKRLNDCMCCPNPVFSAAARKFSISEHLAGLDGLAFAYFQVFSSPSSPCVVCGVRFGK